MTTGTEKIAVTGGLGFIGGHLVRTLVRAGHDVAVLDSAAPTGEQEALGFDLVRVDLRQTEDVERAFTGLAAAGYRRLIHLAGNADALRSITEPHFDFTENAVVTANVLTAAARTGWERALIASSALVYGRQGAALRPESELPDPIYPYSASKLAAEAFATALSRFTELQVVAARLFTVYGPAKDPENSPIEPISYCARALRDTPVTVLGDPVRKVRDFVHVQDVVGALRLLLDKGEAGLAYNVGTGVATSLQSLLESLEKYLGRPVRRQVDLSDMSDSYSIVADISRISQLGYRPAVLLQDALAAALPADSATVPAP